MRPPSVFTQRVPALSAFLLLILTTIAWTNNDQMAHSVTADDGAWDSGLIEPGTTWRHTFEQPGTYNFHCTPHPFMKGVVTVK